MLKITFLILFCLSCTSCQDVDNEKKTYLARACEAIKKYVDQQKQFESKSAKDGNHQEDEPQIPDQIAQQPFNFELLKGTRDKCVAKHYVRWS